MTKTTFGEMAERSNAAVLKTVEGSALREFESHSLRQIAPSGYNRINYTS